MTRITPALCTLLLSLCAAACDDVGGLDDIDGIDMAQEPGDPATRERAGTATDLKVSSWQSEGQVFSKAFCFNYQELGGGACACPAFTDEGALQDNKCTLCAKDEWPCVVTPAADEAITVELLAWGQRSAYIRADQSDGAISLASDATLECASPAHDDALEFAVVRSSPAGGGYTLSAEGSRTLALGGC
ncbi:MAG: hypothetical protein R3A79_22870 [Nannocystaceae bacterium]